MSKTLQEGELRVYATATAIIDPDTVYCDNGYLLNYQFLVRFFNIDSNLRDSPLISLTVTMNSDMSSPNFDYAGMSTHAPIVDYERLEVAIKAVDEDVCDIEYRDYRFVAMKALEIAIDAQRDITNGIQGSWGDVMTDADYIGSDHYKPLDTETVINIAEVAYRY